MKGIIERLKIACETDPEIIATDESLELHPGAELAYLESLGLSKKDLKWLERQGLAVRGRTPNGQQSYETLPTGNIRVKRNFGTGSEIRWMLYLPGSLGSIGLRDGDWKTSKLSNLEGREKPLEKLEEELESADKKLSEGS